jgi:hypothetical protein
MAEMAKMVFRDSLARGTVQGDVGAARRFVGDPDPTPARGNFGGAPPKPMVMPTAPALSDDEEERRRQAAASGSRGTILDDTKSDSLGG